MRLQHTHAHLLYLSSHNNPPPSSNKHKDTAFMSSYSSRSSFDSLTAEKDAMRVREASVASQRQDQQKPQSRRSGFSNTLKSIVTGDVHQHNPRFALERAVMQQQQPTAESRSKPSASSPSTSTSPKPPSPKSSTWKSILSGDVHQHNARYRLEDSAMQKK